MESLEYWSERLSDWVFSKPDQRGELKAWCPVCEEPGSSRTPSAQMNFQTEKWNCFSQNCQQTIGGTLAKLESFLVEDEKLEARKTKRERKARSSFGSKQKTAEVASEELPTDEQITEWNLNLVGLPPAMKYLAEQRGISRETVDKYQIGYDGERFTIPIRNRDRTLVNVRRYDRRAEARAKMINWPGHGSGTIYEPEPTTEESWVLLCEGEWDTLIARQYGFPSVTSTSGAGTFKESYGSFFEDKEVFICFDVDEAGRTGAVKAAKILSKYAKAVYIVKLDYNDKGFDLTNYFHNESRTAEDLHELLEISKVNPYHKRRSADDVPTKGMLVSLEEAVRPDLIGKAVEMVVTVAGRQHPPYAIPRTYLATCSQDKGNVCAVCPMMGRNGRAELAIPADDPMILDLIDANPSQTRETLRRFADAKCKDRIEFEELTHYTVEELVITNSVDHRSEETQAPISQRVYAAGTYRTSINSTAKVVGATLPSPRDRRATFLGWRLEETQTNLDRFEMTPELVESLQIFQPSFNETPLDKLRAIAHDLSVNVTRIYGRPDLHIAYDLVFHSILDFNVFGGRIGKGWLEALIVGDTRTGKSEVGQQLVRHYNAGVVKSCEGATFAGLVGGVQQMTNKWMVTWGLLPLNDRRAVILDEVSGLREKDVIENMSAIRSSGRAQLTKIVQEETSARCRMAWITNPPDGRRLSEQPGSAMTAISQLVRNPEDVARFDFAMAVSGSEVDSSLINTTKPEEVEHVYTSELCAALVMWAWSRTREEVKFERGVERYLITSAEELGSRYVADPPLIQVENVRVKLARIAAAIAARLFSTPDGKRLLVSKEHVDAAVEFLDALYNNEAMGYARVSRRALADRERAARRKEEARQYLRNNADTILAALRSMGEGSFQMRDLVTFGLMEQGEAGIAIRRLIEMRMVKRLARGNVRMQHELIELLREFEDEEEN